MSRYQRNPATSHLRTARKKKAISLLVCLPHHRLDKMSDEGQVGKYTSTFDQKQKVIMRLKVFENGTKGRGFLAVVSVHDPWTTVLEKITPSSSDRSKARRKLTCLHVYGAGFPEEMRQRAASCRCLAVLDEKVKLAVFQTAIEHVVPSVRSLLLYRF